MRTLRVTYTEIRLQIAVTLLSIAMASLLPVGKAQGQTMEVLDTAQVIVPPKPKIPLRLTSFRLGVDPTKPLIAGLSKFYKSPTDYWEVSAELTLNNRFFLSAAYGFSKTGRSDIALEKSYIYVNQGNYYRLGLDYNILGGKTQYDAVFLGLRYSNATFDHSISGLTGRKYWENPITSTSQSPFSAQANGQQANWVSLAVGFKVRIIGGLFGGVEGRLDNLLSYDDSPDFTVVDIPGFGLLKVDQTSKYNFSYSLFYRIPLWKHAAYE